MENFNFPFSGKVDLSTLKVTKSTDSLVCRNFRIKQVYDQGFKSNRSLVYIATMILNHKLIIFKEIMAKPNDFGNIAQLLYSYMEYILLGQTSETSCSERFLRRLS